MKRIPGLTMAAMMATSILVAPALAEEVDTLFDPYGGMIDNGTTASINGDLSTALSAINASSANAAALRGIGENGSVTVVPVSSLANFDKQALDEAVSQNLGSIEILRGTIIGHPALYAQFQVSGFDIASVVGAEVKGGRVIIYVR